MSNFIKKPSRLGMEKAEKIPYSFGEDFVTVLAKTTGFDTKSMIKELTDNAIEANAKNIAISLINYPGNHVHFEIKDDGDGMSMDDIRNRFFKYAVATDKKRGVHAGMGNASICAALANDGKLCMTTHKVDCSPVFVEWDGKSLPTAKYLDEETPIGTSIVLTNIKSRDSLEDEVRGELQIRYWRIRGVNISLNDKEIPSGKYSDPLYWWYKDEKSIGWKYEKTDIQPSGDNSEWSDYRYAKSYPIVGKSGKVHSVDFKIRDMSQIADGIQNLIYRDDVPDGTGKSNKLTTTEFSGVYLCIDDYYITLGNGALKPYINRTWHNICSNFRIAIEIPKELAKDLNYNLNKSKGITDLMNDPAFGEAASDWKRITEIFIQRRVNENRQNEKSTQRADTYRKDIKVGNTLVCFGTTSDKRLSTNTFAIRSNTGEGFDYNINSNVAKKLIHRDGTMGKFDIVADVASDIYGSFIKAMSEARKVQPMINVDLSPTQQAKETRDYTLNVLKDSFDNFFMSITTE